MAAAQIVMACLKRRSGDTIVGYTKQGTCPLIASTYSPDAIKGFVSTIKGHLRNRCGFGRTAHARCHTITVPIRAADAEVASGGARGGAARLGGLWLRGRAAGRALISEGASAVCTSHQSAPHRSASVVGSRTRTTTRHETAGGFACPLLRDLCPLLLCITPSKIKGRVPFLVYPTVFYPTAHQV